MKTPVLLNIDANSEQMPEILGIRKDDTIHVSIINLKYVTFS